MNASITLVLPLPPNPQAGSNHWRAKAMEKQRYFATADTLQGAGRLPGPPRTIPTLVQMSAHMVVGGRMDEDNAKFRAYKLPCDWLKTRGYIVDDKPKHCRMIDPTQEVTRKKPYSLTLILTPLDP